MFKVSEERGDVAGIDVVEVDVLDPGPGPDGEERDEHPPRIPVSADGVFG
jgi:hypothetical protein